MTQDNRDYVLHFSAGWVPGIVVIGLGLLFLCSNLDVLPIYNWWQLWPVVVIAVGLVKLVDSPVLSDRAVGVITISVGGLFLASTVGWLPVNPIDLWPVALISLGLVMICERLGPPAHDRCRWRIAKRVQQNDGVAVFSAFQRRVVSSDYRGAEYFTLFGGGEINLREAGMESDAAIVHVTAIFGGIQFKVPDNWQVVNEVVGIFGGVEDKTVMPSADAPGVKHLIVRGVALFGGVSFKN